MKKYTSLLLIISCSSLFVTEAYYTLISDLLQSILFVVARSLRACGGELKAQSSWQLLAADKKKKWRFAIIYNLFIVIFDFFVALTKRRHDYFCCVG